MAIQHGVCRICGTRGPLSFEHVPPQAAFNDRKITRYEFDTLFEDRPPEAGFDNLRGKQQQRGAGGYTLCGSCNSETGGWYGRAYVDWAYQGLRMGGFAARETTLYFPFNIYPLRVIKEV